MKRNNKKFLIVIDGPSGTGKSTLANLIGKKYSMSVLFPGLLYRYAAKKILENEPKNKYFFLKKLFYKLNYNKLRNLNLHSTKISNFASKIAKNKKIRNIITAQFQKNFVKKKKRVVIEGRDGAKIFPKADIKFFIVCKPLKIAAKRRWLQNKKKGDKTPFKKVYLDLKKRDFMDKNRKHSKLERQPDSVYINTAKLNINEVLFKMKKKVEGSIN